MKFIVAGATALVLTGTAGAQESGEPTRLDRIVVSPNRVPTEKSKVGSKVEQVKAEEIERKSLPVVVDYLNLLPGIAITSTGGLGSEGSLAIRGMPRRYVKTLYNGIDISDPTGPQTQTSYQYLLTGGIDSIEVLKGSQSTLYGSDAIAGVISLSTSGEIDPGIHHLLAGEVGSFGTVRGRYGIRAAGEASSIAFNATGLRTDGISAAAAGTERDGFQNVTFDVSGQYRFNEMFSVFGSGLYIDGRADYDDAFSSPPQDALQNVNLTEQLAGRVGFNLDLLDGRLKNTVSVQRFEVERGLRSVSAFGPYDADYAGTRTKVDYQGSFEATDWLMLQYGADHERQRAEFADPFGSTDNAYTNTGIWAQAVIEPVTDLVFSGGLRHDEQSAFGGFTTYRGAASYLFADTGTRFHSSVGTGFRAPSLFELYDPFSGNAGLQPETSFSFDVGVEQTLLDGNLVADVTWFMLDVDDLIIYDSTTFAYRQIQGTTRSRGVEASLNWLANEWLTLGGSYTYTSSVTETGLRNIRVPRHAFVVSASIEPWENWTIATDAKFVADTVDSGNVELDDYVLLNAKLAYKWNDATEFYVRGENLLDVDYQTANGFNTPGISVFTGFSARF